MIHPVIQLVQLAQMEKYGLPLTHDLNNVRTDLAIIGVEMIHLNETCINEPSEGPLMSSISDRSQETKPTPEPMTDQKPLVMEEAPQPPSAAPLFSQIDVKMTLTSGSGRMTDYEGKLGAQAKLSPTPDPEVHQMQDQDDEAKEEVLVASDDVSNSPAPTSASSMGADTAVYLPATVSMGGMAESLGFKRKPGELWESAVSQEEFKVETEQVEEPKSSSSSSSYRDHEEANTKDIRGQLTDLAISTRHARSQCVDAIHDLSRTAPSLTRQGRG